MIRRSFLFVILLGLAAVFIYAQEKAPEKKAARITGFLVDNMCVKGNDREDRLHPTSCAKMPKCAESGYSIVSKDTVYKLDANGNKLAAEILKNTKQEKGLAVKAVGTLTGDTLAVDSLEEVPAK
jgi:hypothetical protein